VFCVELGICCLGVDGTLIGGLGLWPADRDVRFRDEPSVVQAGWPAGTEFVYC
jgi:hypothetical protein